MRSGERDLWRNLSAAFMSDEETDDENEGFVVRKVGWRSNLLNRLIKKLDERYNLSRTRSTKCKTRCARHLGSPSLRSPPKDVPIWAISKPSHSIPLSTIDLNTTDTTGSTSVQPSTSQTPLQTNIVMPMNVVTPPNIVEPHVPSSSMSVSTPTNLSTPRGSSTPACTSSGSSTPSGSFVLPPRVQLQFSDDNISDDEDDLEFRRLIQDAANCY